jgi:GT2 family glycosyltransferase
VWHEDKGWRKNEILNRAVVAAEGKYLLFLDGDCIPHPKWIEEHRRLRAPGLMIGGRRGQIPPAVAKKLTADKVRDNVKFRRGLFWKALWHGMVDKEAYSPESCLRITSPLLRRMLKVRKGVFGCNFGVGRDDVIRVNGFDERFVKPCVGEDNDIEARLERAGLESRIYSHIATVYHRWHKPHSDNIDDSLAMFEENNRRGITYTPYGIDKADSKQGPAV